jgi:hypothetical protein
VTVPDSDFLEFFERLYADEKFCEALGRMTLAAGRFESNLRAFLNLKGVHVPDAEATLGSLTSKLRKHGLLSENSLQVLRMLKVQRNYLTHSLFDLFSARVEETVLPRAGLVPMDVTLFTEKAWELEQNLSGLSSIVEKQIAQLGHEKSPHSEPSGLLFGP